jgi:PAS domain S-box-containing protein
MGHSSVPTAEDAADLFADILRTSADYSLIGLDFDGCIVFWNEGAARLYGYDQVEVVGKMSLSELLTREDRASVLRVYLTSQIPSAIGSNQHRACSLL